MMASQAEQLAISRGPSRTPRSLCQCDPSSCMCSFARKIKNLPPTGSMNPAPSECVASENG